MDEQILKSILHEHELMIRMMSIDIKYLRQSVSTLKAENKSLSDDQKKIRTYINSTKEY